MRVRGTRDAYVADLSAVTARVLLAAFALALVGRSATLRFTLLALNRGTANFRTPVAGLAAAFPAGGLYFERVLAAVAGAQVAAVKCRPVLEVEVLDQADQVVADQPQLSLIHI